MEEHIQLQKPVLTFNPYEGKKSEVSELDTPFPHRAENIYKIQHAVSWKEGVEGLDRNLDLIRKLYDYMTPFVSKSSRCSYLNYGDIDLGINEIGNASYEQASSWSMKHFKGNIDRLMQVMVDPGNFLTYEQSIPSLEAASWTNRMSE